METHNTIQHNWKDYKYTIKYLREEDEQRVVQFICKKAKMNEEFLEEDIPGLIKDLPNIFDTIDESNKQYFIKVRVTQTEKVKFEQEAKKNKMPVSSYIRYKCLEV